MRLLSRNGTDWTKRYPWVAEAALEIRQKRFVIDGEAVILRVDGISDFNALHSRKHDHEVQLYAFNVLPMGGDDLRSLVHLSESASAAAIGAPAGRDQHSSAARSAPTCSVPPVAWDLKGWSQSIATGHTEAAGRSTGAK